MEKDRSTTSLEPKQFSQEDVDEEFRALVPLMKTLHELTPDQPLVRLSPEAEEAREHVLSDMLDKPPAEAMAEVVKSLAQLYVARTIEYRTPTATVREFATRDPSNQRLDDHFRVDMHDDGTETTTCSFMPFDNMGYEVRVSKEGVATTFVKVGGYTLQQDPDGYRSEGARNNHEEIIHDFVARSLATAGKVLARKQEHPEEARQADEDAYDMTLAEKVTPPEQNPIAIPAGDGLTGATTIII